MDLIDQLTDWLDDVLETEFWITYLSFYLPYLWYLYYYLPTCTLLGYTERVFVSEKKGCYTTVEPFFTSCFCFVFICSYSRYFLLDINAFMHAHVMYLSLRCVSSGVFAYPPKTWCTFLLLSKIRDSHDKFPCGVVVLLITTSHIPHTSHTPHLAQRPSRHLRSHSPLTLPF